MELVDKDAGCPTLVVSIIGNNNENEPGPCSGGIGLCVLVKARISERIRSA